MTKAAGAKVEVATKPKNRKERRKLARRIWSNEPGLEVVHENAAGIDIGSREHYVAISPALDGEPVRSFGCYTEDLHRMAAWLKSHGVKTVVMQSTGVYWIPVYDILEQHGFEVWLVNAKHTRSLPGKKSDVQEAQWLLKLHTFGLLNNSFRPPAQIRRLRTNWRDRATYVEKAGSCVQRMQKALTEMNIQLSNAISDLSGTTGMAILRAIVKGERSGVKLAEHRDPRIKATPAELASSLQGNWLPEQISVLKRQLKDYDHIQSQIADCDVELREILKDIAAAEGKTTEVDKATKLGQRERKPKGNRPHFDLGKELARINGVDLTKIDGIDVMIAQTLLSEIGTDLSRWPTESHFVSWLGLCPDNEVSGGKVLRRGTRNVVSRAATALRMAAFTLIRSQSYLGSQYRRLRTKLGAPKAITAMAHKLARLIYRMLRYGQEYVDKGMALYEEKYKQQQIQLLRKQATKNGFILVPMKATT